MWLCKHTVGRQCSQKGAEPKQYRKICLASFSSHLFLCLFWPYVRGPTTFCWLVCGSVSFHFVPVPYVDLSSIADYSTWKLVATCYCEISVTFYQVQDHISEHRFYYLLIICVQVHALTLGIVLPCFGSDQFENSRQYRTLWILPVTAVRYSI